MTREEKNQFIDELTEQLNNSSVFYLTDIESLNSDVTTKLRGACYKQGIKLQVVKNTLLKKAMEKANNNYEELYDVLKGNTSIMFAQAGNVPAKVIQEFRKKNDKPVLKGAFIEEAVYIGDNQLDFLTSIKSKEELIGDIILLLQSPAKNVVSALKSSSNTIAGLVKALEERAN